MQLNRQRVAMVLGSFVAIIHTVWAILVWLNVAEPFIKWVMGLHFISEPVTVAPFNLGNAVVLVLVTFVVGYVFGFLFSTLWNTIKK